ncbi:MAG: hypothetical protein A3K75_01110 [Euryarchaeota archaeon RBG_13_61_15]|nr:MAG: hypothetical protein A3K75_01110 [Euryarchaeota archaeon RBG_13_61_15]
MTDLRLLICSDLHTSEEALSMLKTAASKDDYDAIVVCGDFTTYGSPAFVRKFLKAVPMRVLAVPGNCDTQETLEMLEAAGASVHDRRVELDGLGFFGFGGGLPSPANMPFEVEEEIMERSLRSNAARGAVMVTHVPAFGMNDKGKHGKSLGSKALLKVASDFKPRLALSGHVHESRGVVSHNGTVFVNPGPAREGFYATAEVGQKVHVELVDRSSDLSD